MSGLDETTIIQLLDNIQPKTAGREQSGPAPGPGIDKRGREQSYEDLAFFKAYLIMFLTGQQSIKGIWKYLLVNPRVASACGFKQLPDRSTFSRRVSKLDFMSFIG